MGSWTRCGWAVAAVIAFQWTTPWAQTTTSGAMRGVVRDINGVGLAGATVVATSEATGTEFGSAVLVVPGVKPQYVDEFVMGVEYAPFDDLRVGAAYSNRRIGRVLEDVSIDNGDTYMIANPGEFDRAEERQLRAKLDQLDPTSDQYARLEGNLNAFVSIRDFDKARRVYHGVTFHAVRRFSTRVWGQATYTYSRTRGNYPGLFSPDTGQLDPNITSQFDLIELLSNRDGPLPQDRTHLVQLDGYYLWRLGRYGQLGTALRMRAASGVPIDTLSRHYLYGRRESYLLPRGTAGRTSWSKRSDVRVSYQRKLGAGYLIQVFLDVFNVVNDQGTTSVDEEHTLDAANPIVGGTPADLVYLKRTKFSSGRLEAEPARRKLNYQKPSGRAPPRSARIGLRLEF